MQIAFVKMAKTTLVLFIFVKMATYSLMLFILLFGVLKLTKKFLHLILVLALHPPSFVSAKRCHQMVSPRLTLSFAFEATMRFLMALDLLAAQHLFQNFRDLCLNCQTFHRN
jgi:hypothetical protein